MRFLRSRRRKWKDFPFEKFFSDNVDESVLDWQPSGAEPSDYDSEVMARRSSVAGQKAIIVHPAEPGCSYLIELNENGEIFKFCVTGPLKISHSVTETGREKVGQLHEEYERLAGETAMKRSLRQRAIEKEYFEHKTMVKTKV